MMLWATYTLAPIGAFALLLFLWNFVCAPFRVERDRRKAAEAKLAEIGGQEPDWEIWRERSHYSVREAGFLLAGQEPEAGPLRGAALARYQEVKWAIDEGKINPEISQFVLSNYRSARQFGPHPRLGETPFRDDWKIRREALLVFIIENGKNIPDTILANLGAGDLARLRQDTE